MSLCARTAAVALASVAALGAAAVPAAPAGAVTPVLSPRLERFDSCTQLVRYAQARVPKRVVSPVTPQATGEPDSAQSAPASGEAGRSADVSGTNVQEAGIDEPDIVKADGSRVLVVAGGVLHSVSSRGEARLLDSLKLDGSGHELLVQGDRVLVIASEFEAIRPLPAPGPAPEPRPGAPAPSGTAPAPGASARSVLPIPQRSSTLLSEIAVSDEGKLRVVRTQRVDGTPVSARQHGSTARVVVNSPARAVLDPALRDRRAGWTPSTEIVNRRAKTRAVRPLNSCARVRRPRSFSGVQTVSILTIDLDRGLPAVDVDPLLGDAQTVYGSAESMVVATQRYSEEDNASSTELHRWSAGTGAATTYRSSGRVSGDLLNQFSLSEFNGVLRVATTQDDGNDDSESGVVVLDERDGRLVQRGRVGGLGRGERIFGVRFVGDVAYVVTFRQTDPLYTIDLSKPDAPRLIGELKIPGYSAYLHPVGEDLLLGVGQDATLEGRRTGAQVSLFDVSDLAKPRRLDQEMFGEGSSSEVENDHRAFSYWAPAQTAVLPFTKYGRGASEVDGGGLSFAGAVGVRVSRAGGLEEIGRVTHPLEPFGAPVRRSVVIGDRLITISEAGVGASELATLKRRGYVAFPRPAGGDDGDRPVGIEGRPGG